MQKRFWRVVIATMFLINFAGIAHFALAQGCDDYSLDHRVENAPFSAQRRTITITQNANGTSTHDEATQSEARDGKGRTYRAGERRWTTVIGNERVQKSEILVRIVDPVANTTTEWSSGSKEVKVVHWPQSNGNAGSAEEPPNPFLHPPAKNSDVQKLGTKTIEGVLVEGIRMSFTASPTQAEVDNQSTDVNECWYSPELKTLILEMHKSRNRSFTNHLENIVRGDPVTSRYQPPADYRRADVEMPEPVR
jgi:hypothetical protein